MSALITGNSRNEWLISLVYIYGLGTFTIEIIMNTDGKYEKRIDLILDEKHNESTGGKHYR